MIWSLTRTFIAVAFASLVCTRPAQCQEPNTLAVIASESGAATIRAYLDGFLVMRRTERVLAGQAEWDLNVDYISKGGTVIKSLTPTVDGCRITSHLFSMDIRDSLATIGVVANTETDTIKYGRIILNPASGKVVRDTLFSNLIQPNIGCEFCPLITRGYFTPDTSILLDIFMSSTSDPKFSGRVCKFIGDTLVGSQIYSENFYHILIEAISPLVDGGYVTYADGRWWRWDDDLRLASPAYFSSAQDGVDGDPYYLTSLSWINGIYEVVDNKFYSLVPSLVQEGSDAQSVKAAMLLEKWDIQSGRKISRYSLFRDTFDYSFNYFGPNLVTAESVDGLRYDGRGNLYAAAYAPAPRRVFVAKSDTAMNLQWVRTFTTDSVTTVSSVVVHPDVPDSVYVLVTRIVPQGRFSLVPGTLRLWRLSADGELSSVGPAPAVPTGTLLTPNPVRDVARVGPAFLQDVVRLEVYPVLGGRVATLAVDSGGEISMAELPAGTYLAVGYTRAGSPVAQQKLVVVR